MRRVPTQTERVEVHSLTQGKCLYCRSSVSFADMEVDHLYPVSRGGSSDKRNLVPACKSCNRKKHARILMDDAPTPIKQSKKSQDKVEAQMFKLFREMVEVRAHMRKVISDLDKKTEQLYLLGSYGVDDICGDD